MSKRTFRFTFELTEDVYDKSTASQLGEYIPEYPPHTFAIDKAAELIASIKTDKLLKCLETFERGNSVKHKKERKELKADIAMVEQILKTLKVVNN